MKSFIYKLTIYILVIFIVLFGLQFIVDNGLKKANDNDFGDWNRIFNGEINSEIIILGNSRAFVQYNPEILRKELGLTCYNLGMDGTPINLQIARLNTLLQFNSKPQTLILNIDLLSLNKGTSIYSYGQYLPYLSNEHIKKAISDYKPNIKLTSVVPMLKYHGLLGLIKNGFHNFFRPKNTYEYLNGYFARNLQWSDEGENFKKITNSNGNIVYSDTSLDYGKFKLQELADICIENSIQLVLVHTPYYHKLYSHLPQQDEVIEYFNSITDYKNVTFIDYSKDSIMYNSDYFYNMTHLNSKGADLFTTILAKELKKSLNN